MGSEAERSSDLLYVTEGVCGRDKKMNPAPPSSHLIPDAQDHPSFLWSLLLSHDQHTMLSISIPSCHMCNMYTMVPSFISEVLANRAVHRHCGLVTDLRHFQDKSYVVALGWKHLVEVADTWNF